MGVSLKKIFNDEGDDLAMNRSANAIKALIYLAGIVFVFLIAAVVIKMFHDQDAMRRKDIIQDMKIIQQNIQVYANKNKTNPQTYPLLGDDLSQRDPIVISTNGVEEEYRYGYYLLDAEKLAFTELDTILLRICY